MSAAKGRFYASKKDLAIVDGVAVAHLLICNLIIIGGSTASAFDWFIVYHSLDALYVRMFVVVHPAIMFIYSYVDYPLYYFFHAVLLSKPKNILYTYGLAELVIVTCSILYSFVVYFLLRMLRVFFKADQIIQKDI
jgi:hypothetical protein